ncbi:retropepsin-like aspartic protease family protein [Candidatus Methylocalor cossyra]|uniref:retropepsin-like aspartic protease family protein n=1 Tax=Candidatus Methylocalor cossyra TaxID=3108543 RepID=UPI0032B30AFF
MATRWGWLDALGAFLGGMLLLAWWGEAAAEPKDLRVVLETLAGRAGFTVEGLDRVAPGPPGVIPEGSPAEQVKALLQDYNYLLVHGPSGSLERVVITSRKASAGAPSPQRAYIETTRRGSQHEVQAILVGPNAIGKTVPLLVDTGASLVVLPASMVAELGFAPEQLRDGFGQTANGTVPMRLGQLRLVRVGAVAAEAVEVGFVADSLLGDAMLLGMSFLRRFRMTIDDQRNELILMAR